MSAAFAPNANAIARMINALRVFVLIAVLRSNPHTP
jgi:hypothetical protein